MELETTIFTRIINGEIPCYKLFEDERTFAFLDIHPRQPGHTLVVPKNPVPYLWDLPQADFDAVTNTARKLALHMRSVMQVPYVYASVVGTDVPHTHMHLIPFTTTDMLHGHEPQLTDDEFAAIAAKLRLN